MRESRFIFVDIRFVNNQIIKFTTVTTAQPICMSNNKLTIETVKK